MLPSCTRRSLPPTLKQILSSHVKSGERTESNVKINGWLKSVRGHKNVLFGQVDDGSDSVQAVFKGDSRVEGEYSLMISLTNGTSVSLSGRLSPSRGPGQTVELLVEETTILGSCDPETYPIQKKHIPAPVLRDLAHLRFRTSQMASVMRVRDAMMRDWHEWFEKNDFVHVHTPILTSSDCEGAGEVFTLSDSHSDQLGVSKPMVSSSHTTISSPSFPLPSPPILPSPSHPTQPTAQPKTEPFFLTPVNLTVSSQLHLEPPTLSLSRTYTLSPCFRAEPSLTSRHLSEFYMLEAELCFIDTIEQLCSVVEESIVSTVQAILSDTPRGKKTRQDLLRIRSSLVDNGQLTNSERGLEHLEKVAECGFERLSYTGALGKLKEGFGNVIWGEGISSEGEKWLAEKGPVFIYDYPRVLKPFYMLPASSSSPSYPSSPSLSPSFLSVACFDLLFPSIGELAGGSLREHRLPQLISALEQNGMDKKAYEWYLDTRRWGSVPHGGWGMGWDRWICWVTAIGNLKDVVAYPRWKGHCKY
ncbi:hypothetical protein TREMEDRAFT_24575 [Tremella mesenterica DSM 1558]|uniref:uncharacterized protein n=1 Tax=Tremella mesenterica (strain ATCC 24925 / CBS 8224 / DSM 1558 / NBRC 9311 / NRRL Y-6157 / RJB 2259-6 / UBC 559-6) TaxID=578456 RepID=UPI0003F49788|nr:uncharacterized protein TREMEDRAFT_24575 [Tremella mesenterica DSM 1558]EIW73510.1 hypothetical protein TREMEDRAFT_24575 [Tremella mesenterica DSM 1558]